MNLKITNIIGGRNEEFNAGSADFAIGGGLCRY